MKQICIQTMGKENDLCTVNLFPSGKWEYAAKNNMNKENLKMNQAFVF